MDLVIGTFNLNNLFDRFNFATDLRSLPDRGRTVTTAVEWTFIDNRARNNDEPPAMTFPTTTGGIVRVQRSVDGRLINSKAERDVQSIAGRIDTMVADHGLQVLAVQEVENIDALRRFNREQLAQPFTYEVLLEGNDPRFIDVGVLSNLPVGNLTSHRFERHPDVAEPIFGRDLLEVDVFSPTGSRRLVKIFVTHMKSNFVRFDASDPAQAAIDNDLERTRQAETTARIIEGRTRTNGRHVLLGDMNDAPDAATLAAFADVSNMSDALIDVVESQPPPRSTNPEDVPRNVRWTNRFSVSREPDRFSLFDQIWVSDRLRSKIDFAQIERRPRWSAGSAGVGSDHDPVWIRLTGL